MTQVKRAVEVLITLTLWISTVAFASELDDCILNGLRGVNSDVAARMVRQACESKDKSNRAAQLVAKYGDWVDADLPVVDWTRSGGASADGLIAKLNNTSQKTVLYVELSVGATELSGSCPSRKDYPNKFLFRVRMKPEASGTFLIPNAGSFIDWKKPLCLTARAVRSRTPSPLDVNFSTYEPLSEAVVKEINNELNTTYAVVLFILQTAPRAGSSITDFSMKDVQKYK